jgi:hypothetical protein
MNKHNEPDSPCKGCPVPKENETLVAQRICDECIRTQGLMFSDCLQASIIYRN